MRRMEAVGAVLEACSEELLIHCNGMVSREAFRLSDRPQSFYMIGSMGAAASIGLGLALARPDRKVVVLDGDGNVLMNLGTLAEVGGLGPENFYHVCFDNEVYGSTGNQATLSSKVDLARVARAAGYRRVEKVDGMEGLKAAVRALGEDPGPVFLLVKVVAEAAYETAGRVTLTPEEIRDRFRSAVGAAG